MINKQNKDKQKLKEDIDNKHHQILKLHKNIQEITNNFSK